MKLHFEEEDLSERQECSALTSNLEGTALNCVMAKKQYQRDTADIASSKSQLLRNLVKPFWIRGAGAPGDDALRETETTRGSNDRQVSRRLGNAVKTQPTG